MSIYVNQSQRVELLLALLVELSQQPSHDPAQVMQPLYCVVPTAGVGQWLRQSMALQADIAANIDFYSLRTLQWRFYQQVLNPQLVAKSPRWLSIKWRIYDYLSHLDWQREIEQNGPMQPLLLQIKHSVDEATSVEQKQLKLQQMFYWVADNVARLFINYMIYRAECRAGCENQCQCKQNWLAYWQRDQALDLNYLLAKEETQSDEQYRYQLQHIAELERWQRHIWREVFQQDFVDFNYIDQLFWQSLERDPNAIQLLPKQIFVFCLIDIAPAQWQFLRRISQYIDVQLLHYNPSQEYWADSVDPRWQKHYQLSHPHAAVLYESRHPLLTRLGKQARDNLSLLANLSGGEDEDRWDDLFIDQQPDNILTQLQFDILHLVQAQNDSYDLSLADDSIQIHVCHSALRQLEVLKQQLWLWLSASDDRQPSDILVLSPQLNQLQNQIRAVFGRGSELGAGDIPIKITGSVSLDALQLWQGIAARFSLLQQRFTIDQLADWMGLSVVQSGYGFDEQQLQRMLELLKGAGFRRGFDDAHLNQYMAAFDGDTRYSFQFAIQRLVLGITIPDRVLYQGVLSDAAVLVTDFELIAILQSIYQDLDSRRHYILLQTVDQQLNMATWLEMLTEEITTFVDAEVRGVSEVTQAIQQLQRTIRLTGVEDSLLPLTPILDEIENSLQHSTGQIAPTGHVTFASLGQLRPIPYRLVVVLNLESGQFPSRDDRIAFDLMDGLRSQMGDRSRLEDDQGAFLDAILQAKQSCWLFYNGFDIADQNVREPAAPLQELMAMLADMIATNASWAVDARLSKMNIAPSLQPLVRLHSQQPFDPKQYFQHGKHLQDQWYALAKIIHRPAQSKKTGWLDDQINTKNAESELLDATRWIDALQHPAKHFLRSAGIQSAWSNSESAIDEPIVIDHLNQYFVKQLLLSNEQSVDLLQDYLPIGKSATPSWQMLNQQWQYLQHCLQAKGALSKLVATEVYFSDQPGLSIELPTLEQTYWLEQNISKARGDRHLAMWLKYLLWIVHRQQHGFNDPLKMTCLFKDVFYHLSGIDAEQAEQYLKQWWQVWQKSAVQYWLLPAALILKPDLKGTLWDKSNHLEQSVLDEMIKYWQNKPLFQADSNDSTMWDLDWQFILQGGDGKEELTQRITNDAFELYAAIIEATETEAI